MSIEKHREVQIKIAQFLAPICFSNVSRKDSVTYCCSSSECLFDLTSLIKARIIKEEVLKENKQGKMPCTIPANMYCIPRNELTILNSP